VLILFLLQIGDFGQGGQRPKGRGIKPAGGIKNLSKSRPPFCFPGGEWAALNWQSEISAVM